MKKEALSRELQKLYDQVGTPERTDHKVNYQKLRRVVNKLQVVSKSCIASIVFRFLTRVDEINVTELYTCMNLEQSVVSNALTILRATGWVIARRSGKRIYYRVDRREIIRINAALKQFNKKP